MCCTTGSGADRLTGTGAFLNDVINTGAGNDTVILRTGETTPSTVEQAPAIT